MRKTLALTAVLITLTSVSGAEAGCLGGAVVGGVAGHFAGHHPVIGAVGGCVVGHHLAVQKKRERRAQRDARRRG